MSIQKGHSTSLAARICPRIFSFAGTRLVFLQRHAELRVGDQNVRVGGDCFQWSNIFSQSFTSKATDESNLKLLQHRASVQDSQLLHGPISEYGFAIDVAAH